MFKTLMAIGLGATLGAWLRWGLGVLLNQGILPMGTLVANLLGGYLMGVALAILTYWPQLDPDIKLLLTTGFLGGLTTFSTFSAEAFQLLYRSQYSLALTHIGLHVIGSIIMTLLGYGMVQWLRQSL